MVSECQCFGDLNHGEISIMFIPSKIIKYVHTNIYANYLVLFELLNYVHYSIIVFLCIRTAKEVVIYKMKALKLNCPLINSVIYVSVQKTYQHDMFLLVAWANSTSILLHGVTHIPYLCAVQRVH